ncbi:hypothetical protein OUZ56_005337 [Daphnia magna]|uniref:Secreted protein n=1 Tax=Daphnia magna TaxID=35525 RepID=A0ABQ9YSV5_9CRUS|nr:hypothetical protein OUZ56_005334 [Daphnia magna]KAK4003580.1 hypothetical protein OUZ56_005337 [Daphnia magna]
MAAAGYVVLSWCSRRTGVGPPFTSHETVTVPNEWSFPLVRPMLRFSEVPLPLTTLLRSPATGIRPVVMASIHVVGHCTSHAYRKYKFMTHPTAFYPPLSLGALIHT